MPAVAAEIACESVRNARAVPEDAAVNAFATDRLYVPTACDTAVNLFVRDRASTRAAIDARAIVRPTTRRTKAVDAADAARVRTSAELRRIEAAAVAVALSALRKLFAATTIGALEPAAIMRFPIERTSRAAKDANAVILRLTVRMADAEPRPVTENASNKARAFEITAVVAAVARRSSESARRYEAPDDAMAVTSFKNERTQKSDALPNATAEPIRPTDRTRLPTPEQVALKDRASRLDETIAVLDVATAKRIGETTRTRAATPDDTATVIRDGFRKSL
jgi:hypothetical protein